MEKQLYSEHGEPETEEFLEKKKKKKANKGTFEKETWPGMVLHPQLNTCGTGGRANNRTIFFQWVDRSQYPLFEPLMFMQRGWGIIQRKRQDK